MRNLLMYLRAIGKSCYEREASQFLLEAMEKHAKEPDICYLWVVDVMMAEKGKTRAEVMEALELNFDRVKFHSVHKACFHLR